MKQKITSSLIVFLICLLTVNSKSTGCFSKVEQLQLFPTKGEKLQINLRDNIFEGEDLTYELQDTYFKIVNPVANTGGISSHISSASNIRAAKPYHTKKMQSWLNSFVFLDQSATEVSIYFSEGTALDKIPTPDFNTKVKIATVTNNLQCYDVEYIDNDKFIVDCQKEVTEKQITKQIDVFYIYSKQTKKITSFDDEASVKIYNQRRIGLYYSTSALGKETTYIVRVTPTYSMNPTDQLSGNSIVQVYALSENYQPMPRNYILDNVTMALLLGKVEIELSIVDFEISYNGFIFLLDAQYGLFVVRFQPTGQWELFASVDFQQGRLYSFDIDYEHKKDGSELGVIAILGYNFFAILDAEKSYVHNLPFFQFEYPATIKISQDNIIIRNDKQTYFYKIDVDTDKIYLNYKQEIPISDVLLINPQEPDLIQISTKNSYRHTISNGYLYYSGSDKVQQKKVVVIKAKTSSKEECTVYLSYQIIEDNENWIYQLFDQPMPFPNIIAEGQSQSILKKLASGPNLQYRLLKSTQFEDTDITTTIRSRVELSLNNEQPKNVIYAEIISTEDDTIFYQVLQTQNMKIQILNCVHNSVYVDATFCDIYIDDLGITTKVNKQNFSIWAKYNVIYFMYIDTQYNVVIRSIHDGVITPVKTIQLDPTVTANKILNILNCGDYLLIHISNNDILTFLIYRPELFVLTTLNKNSFSLYGYNEDWEPKALFTNKKLHPNILFIQHKNHILILDTDFGLFSFIKTIQITPNLDYSIAIGKETFFVVQGKSSNDVKDAQIYEYNFADINHVYLLKKLYLYWYDISTPLNVDYSEDTGHLFVRGVCLYCSKSFVLVFQPNTPQHEALVQAWDIADTLIPDSKSILIAANGFHQTYLYLNVEGEQSLFAVYDQTTMIVYSKIQQDVYSNKYPLNFQIRNYNFQGKPEKFNTIDINQQITTISSLTQIKLNQNDFPFSKVAVEIYSTDETKTFDLGQNWYSGQIGNFEIDCDQCETNIELQSTFDLINPKIFNGYEIRDHIKYNTDFNIMQATTGLIFVNLDNTLASVYDFDLPNINYQCYQATVSEDKMIIYSLCNDGTEFTVYATGCFSITGCSPLGEKFKLGMASKIQIISNELLVVLHTDINNPELVQEGKIVLYKIVMGLQAWKLEVIEIIDLNYLNSKLTTPLNDFRPADFSIVKQKYYQQNKYSYKLFISDSNIGFIFIDFSFSNLPEYVFLSIETLNLHNYLNKQVSQYTLPTTKFLSFQFIWEPIFDWSSNQLRTYLIILTTDASQYGFKFDFAGQPAYNTLLTAKALSAVIVRYGDWVPLNKLAIHNKYLQLAIPYRNENQIIVAVYDIDIVTTNDFSAIVPTISVGTYTIFYEQAQWISPLNLAMFFAKQDKILFVSQLQGPLQSYGIYRSPILILKNQDKTLKSQEITLIAKNNFSEEKLKLKLIVQEVDTNECIAKITNLMIYPSTNEVMQWNLSQNLFDGVSLKYNIDQIDFEIIQNSQQIGQYINHIQIATQIIQAKALITQNRAWSNQFGFLNKDNSKYSIFYTNIPTFNNAPSFNQIINIKKTDINLNCIDFLLLSSNSFIIDCQIQNNKFLLLIQSNQETQYFKVESLFLNRVMDTYKIKDDQYVVRVTLSINNEGQLANNSFVELFQVTNEGLISKTTLDKTKLINISGKQINQLNIVDFKIGLNGQIYLLDAKIGIFVVFFDTDWKFSKFIGYNFGQSFAFDRTVFSNNEEMFVIKGYNYYGVINQEGKIKKVQDLPFASVTYPQQIMLSHKYVFLHNQGNLYIYHTDEDNSSLIDIMNVSNGAGIVNPNSQDIVILSLTSSSAWTFSLGQLKFNGNAQASTNFKTLTISAKSQHNQVCYSRIFYQVLASNSETIFKKVDTETPFPKVLDENDEQVKLGSLVSGPNLIYEIIQPKSPLTLHSNNFMNLFAEPDLDVFAQIAHQRTIKVNNWPKKSLYQTSLIGNNQETLFQVFQQEDKKVIIQTCELTDHVRYECKDFGNVQVKEQLSDQLFSIWQDSENIVHFIILETPFIIKFFKIKNSQTVQYGFIKLNENEEKDELKVLAFQNQGDFIFLIQENGELSSYSTEKFTLINKVTGVNLIGFQGDWKPIKLYGNRILRQNVIFVQNENNVAIINYSNQEFIYGQQINYTKGNQIYITQSVNSFFFVNNKELSEYNYEIVNNVFKQKTVELFGYQITNPLGVSSHLQTGILIIRTTKNDNVYLNIFKPDQLQHDTFYLAVKINAKVDDIFAVSACGSDPIGSAYIITLVSSEVVQQLDFIVLDPQLIIIPNKQKQKYLTDYEITINVKNADSQNNNLLPFTQKVKVINTFTNLIVDDTNQIQQIDIEPKQNSTSIKLKNGWINGQQAYCTLKQEKANDIVLQSYLQETKKEALTNHQIKDVSTFQKNVILQAKNTVLLMKDNKLEESKPILDILGQEYDCFRITSYEKSIYSLCNNGVEDQIQVASCNDKQECKRENAYISSPFATQIVTLAQDVVVILHTDSLNPENYDGYITIHKLISIDAIWSQTLLFTIDYQFIQSKLGAQTPKSFRPSSFLHSLTHSDDNLFAFQFIISDSVNGLLFIDLTISKTTFDIKFLFMEYQLLNKWLNDNKQYANDYTHYYSNKIIEESIKDKTKTITIVVVTDNSSSYIFALTFAISDNHSNKLTDTKVIAALNRYGSWKALNTVAANKQSVVLAFVHNSKVVVGVYHISDNAVQAIKGSFSFTIAGTSKLEPIDFPLYLQDSTLISSKASKGLNQYEIRQDISLNFGESAKLENQTLTITFFNDYRTVSKQIKLNIKPDAGGDDDGGSSSKAWWITLIVAGSILILGLIGFLFYKKRNYQDEDQDDQESGLMHVN
ncbi:unnamed protein product [Paramecium pentaurelia]|uniref:Transmembrane protein n=1 Tax=Paramecium pentaurelia TaxID=43138 RepID=A0A8S1V7J1_9CILI|nr:unnamed protein product [Paramecium pentaurelia]